MSTPLTRSGLYTVLEAAVSLDDFLVYAEPPDQLVRQSIVIAPRDPYQDEATFGSLTTFVSVSVLVPRTHGPAMDVIDSALTALRAIFVGLPGCRVGDTYVGLTDRIGGTEYLAAMVNLDLY